MSQQNTKDSNKAIAILENRRALVTQLLKSFFELSGDTEQYKAVIAAIKIKLSKIPLRISYIKRKFDEMSVQTEDVSSCSKADVDSVENSKYLSDMYFKALISRMSKTNNTVRAVIKHGTIITQNLFHFTDFIDSALQTITIRRGSFNKVKKSFGICAHVGYIRSIINSIKSKQSSAQRTATIDTKKLFEESDLTGWVAEHIDTIKITAKAEK